jgi:tetratricopeptide (TPR) repeat protein
MRQIFYFFVIISLSFTVNAQLKERSLEFENEKQTSSADPVYKESAVFSEEVAALNQSGINAALKENDYRKANNFFRQAAGLAPGCFVCRYNLGKSLLTLENLDEAVDVLTKLVKDKPDFANAYAILGDALFNKNRFDESIAAYQKALAIAPDEAFTLCNLGIAQHHSEKYEDALQSFGRAIKANPQLAEAYSNRGVTLFNLNRLKEALTDLRLAEKINPDVAEIENNIGVTLSAMDKRKEAHKYFERALQLKPDYADARYNLALSFLEQNERKQADDQLRQLEKINYAMADKLRKQFWKKYVVNADDMKKALN